MGTFLSFILFILFIFVGLPLIRILIAVFSATRKIKKQYKQQNPNGSSRSDSYSGGYAGQQQRRKHFSQNDGEYVDFEEITSDDTITDKQPKRANTKAPKMESQISDAQFEEID